MIVLERNRRIAKAYARAPVLTVNGSEDGFDGFRYLTFFNHSTLNCQNSWIINVALFRIGVNGFENPLRDPKTEEFKKQIGTGCKLKMDDTGRFLILILATIKQ